MARGEAREYIGSVGVVPEDDRAGESPANDIMGGTRRVDAQAARDGALTLVEGDEIGRVPPTAGWGAIPSAREKREPPHA